MWTDSGLPAPQPVRCALGPGSSGLSCSVHAHRSKAGRRCGYPVRVAAIYLSICWVGQNVRLAFSVRCCLRINFWPTQYSPRCQTRCQQRAMVTTHGVLLGTRRIEQADGSREGCCGSGWVEHGVTWKHSVWGASRDRLRDPVGLGV